MVLDVTSVKDGDGNNLVFKAIEVVEGGKTLVIGIALTGLVCSQVNIIAKGTLRSDAVLDPNLVQPLIRWRPVKESAGI